MPVRNAEHSLSYRQSRRAVAEGGDHSGQFVAEDRGCSVTVAAIGPGRGPLQLGRDESRRMNLNDDVVYRCRRLGPSTSFIPTVPAAWSITTIAFIVHLPVWSLLSTCDGDAASPGAQRRYTLKPCCHWCWRDETRVGDPRTGGHAFWNPELASAEDHGAAKTSQAWPGQRRRQNTCRCNAERGPRPARPGRTGSWTSGISSRRSNQRCRARSWPPRRA